jgi:hypothetical protein
MAFRQEYRTQSPTFFLSSLSQMVAGRGKAAMNYFTRLSASSECARNNVYINYVDQAIAVEVASRIPTRTTRARAPSKRHRDHVQYVDHAVTVDVGGIRWAFQRK